jgi:hypothetical protein
VAGRPEINVVAAFLEQILCPSLKMGHSYAGLIRPVQAFIRAGRITLQVARRIGKSLPQARLDLQSGGSTAAKSLSSVLGQLGEKGSCVHDIFVGQVSLFPAASYIGAHHVSQQAESLNPLQRTGRSCHHGSRLRNVLPAGLAILLVGTGTSHQVRSGDS